MKYLMTDNLRLKMMTVSANKDKKDDPL